MSLPAPYYDRDGVTLYCADCRDVLSQVCADVLVTDPPYGTGGWRRLEAGAGSNPSGSLVQEAWDDGAVDWLGLTCAEAGLVFWPAARTQDLLTAATARNWTKHRCLYMQKRDPKPMCGGRIAWSVEPIWVLSRDGYQLFGGTDWYTTTTPRSGRDAEACGHRYQKPLAVLRWLIGKTPSGSVLDPFAGSGTTLVAAKQLGRRAIGIEINPDYCAMAVKRLAQGVLLAV